MAQLLALGALAPAANYRECQRWPVESGDRDEGVPQVKRLRDVRPNLWRRRRRETRHWRPPPGPDRPRQKAAGRPEVMSPCGDAVRLVDDHSTDSKLGQTFHETWTAKSLGGQEQQPVFACDCPTEPIDLLGPLHRRVDERRGYAPLREAVDLVLHKRDERRHDQCQPAIDHRWYPVADALPGPGGRDRENVASREHRRHHLSLPGAEGIQAEDVTQHAICPGDHPRESD